jgi:hypothetical protein
MRHPLARARGRLPFVVAHRAGNDVATLRRAEALRIPLVELDVHLYRGRLEVRHLKTLGPVPVLWDRWRLSPGWNARMTLEELLEASAPDTELMLDLKGGHPRLGTLVAATLDQRAAGARVTVCSRWWRQLDPSAQVARVRVVHSIGSRRQLAAFARRIGTGRAAGVSVHRRLLDADTVGRLRERADVILSWPVATPGEARLLGGWGVDGVITERYEELAAALRPEVAA